MDIIEKIFTWIGPFLSAYLVYIFAIKKRRKETDFHKEEELNAILSNLLLVWNYLTRIEKLIEILKGDDTKSIVPKKYFPIIVLKSGFLNDKCFLDLDSSIDILKKYDPILFFKLEGIGNFFDTVRKRFIMPFLKNPNNISGYLDTTAGLMLNDTLNDLEEYMETVAKKINRDTLRKVRTYINDHLASIDIDLIEEINEKYYEVMMQIIPDSFGEKPTLKEFVEFAKTDDFKKIVEIQLDLVVNNTLDSFLDLISNNPDIALEDIQAELDKRQT